MTLPLLEVLVPARALLCSSAPPSMLCRRGEWKTLLKWQQVKMWWDGHTEVLLLIAWTNFIIKDEFKFKIKDACKSIQILREGEGIELWGHLQGFKKSSLPLTHTCWLEEISLYMDVPHNFLYAYCKWQQNLIAKYNFQESNSRQRRQVLKNLDVWHHD